MSDKNGKRTILVVEDDKSISGFICSVLQSNGYAPILANDGKQAKLMISSQPHDLIILDLGLPDIDGFEIIKWVRTWSSVPIIIVSARDRESEKVYALDLGADDYITKPFGIFELIARIKTAFRHSERIGTPGDIGNEIITVKDLKVDTGKRKVYINEEEIKFTAIEYKIVAFLAKYAGKVITYDFLIKEIWGPYAMNDNNQILRVNMANIRRKMKENPSEPKYIVTELGVGYRMLEE